jgi:hypothetical protein
MKWFAGVTTIEEAKKRYRELAMKHHPDLEGGDLQNMTEINLEYEKVMKGQFDEKQSTTKSYMDVVSEIIKHNVNVENIGSWLWVSGSHTFSIKSELKTLGFQWSSGRKMWFWAEGVTKKKRIASNVATDVLRQVYGSKIIKTESDATKLS